MLSKFTTLSLTFLLTMPAMAALTSELPKGDSLRGITRGIDQILVDNNISTGRSTVAAKKLNNHLPTKSEEQKQVVESLFKTAFRTATSEKFDDEHLPLRTSVEGFNPAIVKQVALALAEGNAYDTSNKENIEPMERKVWAILIELGVDEKTFVGRASANVSQANGEEKRNVVYFVFINRKTGHLVEFFSLEGSM